jgi:branched-chain amino acid transport system permease protein
VVFPDSFNILVSINALALIILGGMGNIAGVVLGAFVLVGLPELLREFAEYRLLIYGAVLVAMMLLRPEGLLPSRARRAELHERADDDEEIYEQESGEETGRPVVSS